MFRLFIFALPIIAACWSADARAQNATCTGSGTGTFGNLTVPDGSSCNLSNATVNGNITVGKNSKLIVSGGITTIAGNVQANQCQSVMLMGSVLINGDVEIHQCAADGGYVGPGIEIGGNFECHNNSGACIAQMGTVTGDLHIHNNSSQAPSDISFNTIGGDLQCAQNTPPPINAEGPNQIDGNVQGQCAAGFTLVTVPPATLSVGPAGGTLTDSNGDQVVIPPGALAAATTVSLRPALLDEVQVALQSTAFAGQKLNFLGAVHIDASGASFAVPVQLAIPNVANLAPGGQIFLVKISPDVTGDGIPDLILLDTASVVGNLIQDAPGATGSGTYGFAAIKPPNYTNVQGRVVGAGSANSFVQNSQALNVVVQADAQGNFQAPVISPTAPTVFTATASNLLQGGTTVGLPIEPIIPIGGPIAQAIAQALDHMCKDVSPSLDDKALNAIADRYVEFLDGFSKHIDLFVLPTPQIPRGATTNAIPDIVGFLTDEANDAIGRRFGVDVSTDGLLLKSFLGIANIQLVGGVVSLISSPALIPPSITIIPPSITITGPTSTNPTFTVMAQNVGTPDVLGSLVGVQLSAALQLETTEPDGTQCIPITVTNEFIDSKALEVPIDPRQIAVIAGGGVTSTYVYNGPAFTSTSLGGAPPGDGPNFTGTVKFNVDTSNFNGWYGAPAPVFTQVFGTQLPIISNPIMDVQLASGAYSGSLSSSTLTTQGGPVFFFQNGVITQWFILFVSGQTVFLTENWPVFTEDSLFLGFPNGTNGTGEIGGPGVWVRQ